MASILDVFVLPFRAALLTRQEYTDLLAAFRISIPKTPRTTNSTLTHGLADEREREREREREKVPLEDWKTECFCTAAFVTTKVHHYFICMPQFLFFFILHFILLLFPYLRMGCRHHTSARRNDSVRMWLSHNHHK